MALPIPNSNHVNKRCCAKKKITAKSYYYNSNAEQKRTNQQCPLRVFPFHLKMNSGVARRIFMFFPCLDGVMFWLVDIIFKFIQYRLIAHTFGSKMQSSFSLGFHLVNGFALVWVQLVSELSSHTYEDRHIDTYIHMKQMWNIPIVYKIPRNATFGMQQQAWIVVCFTTNSTATHIWIAAAAAAKWEKIHICEWTVCTGWATFTEITYKRDDTTVGYTAVTDIIACTHYAYDIMVCVRVCMYVEHFAPM